MYDKEEQAQAKIVEKSEKKRDSGKVWGDFGVIGRRFENIIGTGLIKGTTSNSLGGVTRVEKLREEGKDEQKARKGKRERERKDYFKAVSHICRRVINKKESN